MKSRLKRGMQVFLAIAVILMLVPIVFSQEQGEGEQNQNGQTTQQEEQGGEEQQRQEEQKTKEQVKQEQQQQKVGAIPIFLPIEEATQDFIVQVVDYQPKIITSDLLEEQDVSVYAQIALFKINPIISVPKIRNIHPQILNQLQGEEFPRKFVSTVFWQQLPGRRLSTDNAGYLVLRLKGGIPESE